MNFLVSLKCNILICIINFTCRSCASPYYLQTSSQQAYYSIVRYQTHTGNCNGFTHCGSIRVRYSVYAMHMRINAGREGGGEGGREGGREREISNPFSNICNIFITF